MSNGTDSAARIAQLERQLDTALAAYDRAARSLTNANQVYNREHGHPHEGWDLCLRSTRGMLGWIDVQAAAERWAERELDRLNSGTDREVAA